MGDATRPIRETPERRDSRRHDRRVRVNWKKNLALLRAMVKDDDQEHEAAIHQRPRTRSDCIAGGCNAARPCPWVSCRHHLGLDVSESGSVILHPHIQPWEHRDTCALDVAERGGLTLEEVGRRMDLTRERVRQLEKAALAKVRDALLGGEDDDGVLLESKAGHIPWGSLAEVPTTEEWVILPSRRKNDLAAPKPEAAEVRTTAHFDPVPDPEPVALKPKRPGWRQVARAVLAERRAAR